MRRSKKWYIPQTDVIGREVAVPAPPSMDSWYVRQVWYRYPKPIHRRDMTVYTEFLLPFQAVPGGFQFNIDGIPPTFNIPVDLPDFNIDLGRTSRT